MKVFCEHIKYDSKGKIYYINGGSINLTSKPDGRCSTCDAVVDIKPLLVKSTIWNEETERMLKEITPAE